MLGEKRYVMPHRECDNSRTESTLQGHVVKNHCDEQTVMRRLVCHDLCHVARKPI